MPIEILDKIMVGLDGFVALVGLARVDHAMYTHVWGSDSLWSKCCRAWFVDDLQEPPGSWCTFAIQYLRYNYCHLGMSLSALKVLNPRRLHDIDSLHDVYGVQCYEEPLTDINFDPSVIPSLVLIQTYRRWLGTECLFIGGCKFTTHVYRFDEGTYELLSFDLPEDYHYYIMANVHGTIIFCDVFNQVSHELFVGLPSILNAWSAAIEPAFDQLDDVMIIPAGNQTLRVCARSFYLGSFRLDFLVIGTDTKRLEIPWIWSLNNPPRAFYPSPTPTVLLLGAESEVSIHDSVKLFCTFRHASSLYTYLAIAKPPSKFLDCEMLRCRIDRS